MANRLAQVVALPPRPSTVEALQRLVSWMVDRGARQEALPLAQRAEAEALLVEPDHNAAAARCDAAEALTAVEAWDEALALVQPLLADGAEVEPIGRDRAKRRAAEALAGSGRFDDALGVANTISTNELTALSLTTIAVKLLLNGEEARGEEVTRRAAAAAAQMLTDEERGTVLTAVAYDFAQANLARQALSLARTIPLKERQDEAYSVLAYLLANQGNLEAAHQAALAIGDYGKRNDRLEGLVRLSLNRGDFAGALATEARLDTAYRQSEALGECADRLAQEPLATERRSKSAQLKERARPLEDRFRLEVLGRLGQALLSQQDSEEAEQIAQEALASVPVTGPIGNDLYVAFANAFVEVQAADKAVDIVDRVLLQRPGAHFDAARVLARLGQWQRAREVAAGLDDLSSRCTLFAELAESALTEGQAAQAQELVRLMEEALPRLTMPGVALTEARLARIYLLLNKKDLATELAQKAFQRFQAQPQAADPAALGQLLARAGHQDHALQCLAVVDNIFSKLRSEVRIAEGLADAGNASEATAMLEKMIEGARTAGGEDYRNYWLMPLCAEALAKVGQPDEALRHVEAIQDPGKQLDTLIDIGKVLRQAMQVVRIGPLIERALHIADACPQKRFATERAHLASLRNGPGHQEEATRLLQLALGLADAESSDALLQTLAAGAPVLAALDQGRTLAEILTIIESMAWTSSNV
jgi:hypothetical protein